MKPKCYYCHATLTRKGHRRVTWDHRVPKSRGGTNDEDNLVAACFTCNQEKGSMTEEQFRAVLNPARQDDDRRHCDTRRSQAKGRGTTQDRGWFIA